MAGLTYSPIASGLKGDLDLESVLQYAGDVDLDPATTQPGKDANVALASIFRDLDAEHDHRLLVPCGRQDGIGV
ncbi:hypothetical protein [Modestobacter sp. DSM 44400]|uniref:hypothetical protein n=1 Tax=Modestobacter sp. DSM 44400 TaxID=1550230 RepID=UPI000B890C8F|nr:hypothetical protein [Modestobacter sp. DSM 44400]